MKFRYCLGFLFTFGFWFQMLPATVWAMDITITKADGAKVNFVVEIAKTEDELAKGLMYVKQLDKNKGMLFDFSKEQKVQMWMKNTLIPLDMLFIKQDGRIVYIAENTTPLSLSAIGPREPVRYVLEISGGEAAKNGMKVGDFLE